MSEAEVSDFGSDFGPDDADKFLAQQDVMARLEEDYGLLVHKLAANVRSKFDFPDEVVAHDDLYQVGFLALLDSRRRYDPSHESGAKFSTFAYWRVLGAMYDSIDDQQVKDGWSLDRKFGTDWGLDPVVERLSAVSITGKPIKPNLVRVVGAKRGASLTDRETLAVSLYCFTDPFKAQLLWEEGTAQSLTDASNLLVKEGMEPTYDYIAANMSTALGEKIGKNRVSEHLTAAAKKFSKDKGKTVVPKHLPFYLWDELHDKGWRRRLDHADLGLDDMEDHV